MTSSKVLASLVAATLYEWNHDMNHKHWNIRSIEGYILHMQVLLECYYIKMEILANGFHPENNRHVERDVDKQWSM